MFRKRKKEGPTDEENRKEKKKEYFDQEQLEEVWKEFRELRINNGAGDMEQLLLSRELKIENENELIIFLNSALEISILERFEHELVIFLREKLQNDFINIEKEVKEEEQKEKLYTSSDKYDYMAKQNPNLKKLKERLGLDFDY